VTARLAVITGAAGGLGVPLSRSLGRAGYELLLVDMSPTVDEVAGTLRSEGLTTSTCIADLSGEEGVASVAAAVRATGTPLHLLVNNAGITRDARVQKMTVEQFEQVIDVNLLAAMRLTAGLEDLFAEGSSVISMSSRAALGNFGQANYVTSKSALVGFTRALAQQWAPRVRANAVAPGLVDTPMTQAMPPEVLASLVAKVPAQRIGTPEDIASTVVWLASDESSYVTGQYVVVCGGRSLAP
jgi:3-oxoacyl-[acyl-carrier protein] reductase